MIHDNTNIEQLKAKISAELMTVDVFTNLPEVRVSIFLRDNLLSVLSMLGCGTQELVDEAVSKVKLPKEELALLNQLTYEEGQELLLAFTMAVAQIISLYKQKRLPVNWEALLNI